MYLHKKRLRDCAVNKTHIFHIVNGTDLYIFSKFSRKRQRSLKELLLTL